MGVCKAGVEKDMAGLVNMGKNQLDIFYQLSVKMSF